MCWTPSTSKKVTSTSYRDNEWLHLEVVPEILPELQPAASTLHLLLEVENYTQLAGSEKKMYLN